MLDERNIRIDTKIAEELLKYNNGAAEYNLQKPEDYETFETVLKSSLRITSLRLSISDGIPAKSFYRLMNDKISQLSHLQTLDIDLLV